MSGSSNVTSSEGSPFWITESVLVIFPENRISAKPSWFIIVCIGIQCSASPTGLFSNTKSLPSSNHDPGTFTFAPTTRLFFCCLDNFDFLVGPVGIPHCGSANCATLGDHTWVRLDAKHGEISDPATNRLDMRVYNCRREGEWCSHV